MRRLGHRRPIKHSMNCQSPWIVKKGIEEWRLGWQNGLLYCDSVYAYLMVSRSLDFAYPLLDLAPGSSIDASETYAGTKTVCTCGYGLTTLWASEAQTCPTRRGRRETIG